MNSFAKALLPSRRAAAAVGTVYPEARLTKAIDDAQHEGSFRADDCEVDLLALRELDERRNIVGLDGDIGGEQRRARVARRHENRGDTRRAANRPCERVFPGARTDDQNFQSCLSSWKE
jgi:hypothetical protein